MTVTVRTFAPIVIPALLLFTSVGCSTLGRGKCKSCESNQVYMAPTPMYDQQPNGYSAPTYSPAPIPVPPATFPDTTVPPPPTGEAARPSTIQRMRGATTTFFMNANENVRSTLRR